MCEMRSIFIIFKGLLVAKNCLRPESAPLNLEAVLPALKVTQNCYMNIEQFFFLKTGSLIIY